MPKRTSTAEALDQAIHYEDARYAFSRRGPVRKKPLGRAATAGEAKGEWDEIIDTLYSEHGYILSLLNTLEKEADRLKTGKIPDYHLLLEIVDYLVHYPGEFHHPREDLLFGALLKQDKKFKPRLERLEREHESLLFYNDKLFGELTRIVDGGAADQPALRTAIRKFVAGYRKHINYESTEIFPLARGTLTGPQLKKIEEKTRFDDDPLFGAEVKRRYRRISRNLRATIGNASDTLIAKELETIEPAIGNLSELLEKVAQWRDSVDVPGKQFLEDQFENLKDNSIFNRGPSWQARVLNLCTRTMMKPMMRYGTVESVRELTGRFDGQSERFIADDISARMVSKKDYEGEWVRVKGKRARKTLLYLPGGGFIMRTPTQHKRMVANICRAANARALIVHYSLAPEVPFPGGLENCVAAYHDLLKSGYKPEDITIAGDSAGGGLVLSTLLALRDEGTAMPGNAIVLSPLADLTYSGGSRRYNKCKDPMLPTHRASEMHQLYIGEALPEDRFLSPIFADFKDLPPMLGVVGSTEILLDDTVRAADKAKEAGVPFYLEVWEKLPHVFPIFGVLPEARVSIERMAQFINHGELDPLPKKYGRSEYRLRD